MYTEVNLHARQKRDLFKSSLFGQIDLMSTEAIQKFVEVQKVDEGLGLVFGYAIVCKEDGEPYFDVQGDHIPEGAMMKASADFMQNARVAKEMHRGDPVGTVVFAFPITDEIAKSLDLTARRTGLMIAMMPSPEVLAKFASGELTGFSIGGRRITDKEFEDA